MVDFEKLGLFYLGKRFDLKSGEIAPEAVLYDSKDLTTHAVCVGMTGSGKTGLAIGLLEEAAIDGIPVIAIDPKGDLGNLLLTFPDLQPQDFRPWIDESDAARMGRTPEEQSKWMADLWRNGLAEWDQQPERIRLFADSVEGAIYTPGSSAGFPVSILGSLKAPAAGGEDDALREKILSAVSSLLALFGIEADPIRSREHILLSSILDLSWRQGQSLDLPSLIGQIQKPPFKKVGVFDLETFFPAKDRLDLAMTINNLLASPGFSVWTTGVPLEIGNFLFTPQGKPRLSIFSISHLSDSERMFFVSLLLNEVVSWMRTQPGSRTLRAILYMDEIFGFFPPTANPPSKTPMLTLLKQARAFGLGVVLSTQNPVDLDYKGLSNAGTWFLGRLQTERDKNRILDGLEGAAVSTGESFDRAHIGALLSGLGNRVFFMKNVHEDEPILFQTRWVLSYLAGPLSREKIRELTEKEATDTEPEDGDAPGTVMAAPSAAGLEKRGEIGAGQEAGRPMIPAEVPEFFLQPTKRQSGGGKLVYRPALLGEANLHYSNSRMDIDLWKKIGVLAPLESDENSSPWDGSVEFDLEQSLLLEDPGASGDFVSPPPAALNSKSYSLWKKKLTSHLYQERRLALFKSKRFRLVSRPGEPEGEFRGRLRSVAREERDLKMEKLRQKYAPKLKRLQDRIQQAEHQAQREKAQYNQQKMQTAISIGASVLGAMFGRKLASATNIGKATTAIRGAGRAARERGDISRALQKLKGYQQDLQDLEGDFQEKLEDLKDRYDDSAFEVQEVKVPPRKSDISNQSLKFLWTPWEVDSSGMAKPLFNA